MNTMISNQQQSIYKLIIDFEKLMISSMSDIDLSLLPISFLSTNPITEEVTLKQKKIQQKNIQEYRMQRNSSDNMADYTTFLFIDIQTGLCWDVNMKTYTCWLEAVTDAINDNLWISARGIKIFDNERKREGLFNINKFSNSLGADVISL